MPSSEQWYGLFLGSGDDALPRRLQIQSAFIVAYAAAGQPKNMAIFSKSGVTDAGAHEVTLYFSPATASFAKSIAGVAPCDKPSLDGLGLEIGTWHSVGRQ